MSWNRWFAMLAVVFASATCRTDQAASQTLAGALHSPEAASPRPSARLHLVADEKQAAPATPAAPTPPAAGSSPAVPAPPVPSPPPGMPTLQTPPRNGADPTVPGPAIRELLGQGDPRSNTTTPTAVPGLPVVRMRARISVHNKPTIAILEVDGRMVSVREGFEFTVPGDGSPSPLKVIKLSATELQLEVVNRRAVINLN